MKLSRKLPLNAIRVFEAVARLSSFTRAGEELGMTQTAVSYQMKLLEEHLGELLFIRQTRRITLTETGERLLPKVSEAFGLLAEAIAEARQEAGGILEIRSTPTFASHWLASHIGAFQLQHPGLAVRILRIEKPVDFRADNADVVIWRDKRPPADVEAHELFRLRYAPMLSPKLAETIGGVKTPADLLKLPLIGGGREWWLSWCAMVNIDNPTFGPNYNEDTYGALDLEGNAAIAGHGVALLSRFFHQDDLEAGRLIMPFDVFKEDHKTYWLISPKSRRRSAKVVAFRQWMTETLPPSIAPAAPIVQ
jgi:LysR family transcriptional regulator, glycine cleavage system transcriptional activator